MNILFISLGREYGGTEKIVENLIEGFSSNRNYNITIICLKDTRFFNIILDKFKKVNNISIIGISKKKIRIINNIYYVRKILKHRNIDLVHVHSIISNLVFQIANLNINKKSIITVHSRSDFDRTGNFKSKIMNKLELMLLKNNNRVIAVSNSIKKYLNDCKLHKCIKVIHNGTKHMNDVSDINEINKFKKFYFDKNSLVVTFVGRLTEVKGIFNLVEIAKRIIKINDNVKFLVIGEGELKSYIEDEIVKSNLNNIKLLGFKKDVDKYIPYSDLLIMPSNMEGIPITILEGMSCGIPCIGSNVGGIPEIINKNNGILYENRNIDELLSRIDFIEKNRDVLKLLKEQCKEEFLDKWSIDKLIENYKYEYNSIKSNNN